MHEHAEEPGQDLLHHLQEVLGERRACRATGMAQLPFPSPSLRDLHLSAPDSAPGRGGAVLQAQTSYPARPPSASGRQWT